MPDAHHSRDARRSKQVTMRPRPYYAKMQSPDNRGGVIARGLISQLSVQPRGREKGNKMGKRAAPSLPLGFGDKERRGSVIVGGWRGRSTERNGEGGAFFEKEEARERWTDVEVKGREGVEKAEKVR